MSDLRPRTVVAIPAMNEVDRIGACLGSLADQQGGHAFSTVVLANNCTDATAAVALSWRDRLPDLIVESVELPSARAHAGEARRLAMLQAASVCDPDGVLLTTDADVVLPPNWVQANLAAIESGADAVAGRAIIDPLEASSIPRHLHELDALECSYAALLDEIASLLTPDPHDPWPRHDEHSGASIAVRVAAWRAVGGMPSMPSGEDRAFFASLRRIGARIRHAPDVAVIVSGRLQGRASGGMAETIRNRIIQAPEWLDDRLQPVDDVVWTLLRNAPPPGGRRRVAFNDLAEQMARARAIRDQLRAPIYAAVSAASA